MFLLMMRVGEARVPGPDNGCEWTLGVCNPSGLQGKFHVLNNVQADVLALSETHMTAAAKRSLQLSLKAMGSKYRHIITGAPMEPRSQASEAGAWAGVGFASTMPCRTVATDWPDDLYQTGRIQLAAFHTLDSWTLGAVVYGFPEGKTHPMAHQRTEDMLDFAVQRLSKTPGPPDSWRETLTMNPMTWPLLMCFAPMDGLRSKTYINTALAPLSS